MTSQTETVRWAIMKAQTWDSIKIGGLPLQNPDNGPQRFIPVFDTREQAVAWAGSDEHVVMLLVQKEK